MSLLGKYNPYDFQNPVQDKDLFVGREAEGKEIGYYLDQAKAAPRPMHVVLIGKRASGKTSLLNMAKLWAHERGLEVVSVELDDDDASSQLSFFFKIYNALLLAVITHGGFDGLRGTTYRTYLKVVNSLELPDASTAFPLLFPVQYALAMQKGHTSAPVAEPMYKLDLDVMCKEAKRPIVLMIDEGSVLANSRVTLQKLRNSILNTAGVMVILAATPKLTDSMDQAFSPILRQFKRINVGRFSEIVDTERLIRRPLEKIGLNPSEYFSFDMDRGVGEIHELAGGRPQEIQLICHILFKRVQEGRSHTMRLDYAALEEIRRELETTPDFKKRTMLARIRGLSREQLWGLGILGNCNGAASFDQLTTIYHIFRDIEIVDLQIQYRDLLSIGILEEQDGKVAFSGDDFDRIYIKYLARELEVQCSFVELPVQEFQFFALKRELARYSTLNIVGSTGSDRVFEDHDRLLRSMGDPNLEEDIFTSRDETLMTLFQVVEAYQSHASIPCVVLHIQFEWGNMSALMFFNDPDFAGRHPHLAADITNMAARAEARGVRCQVEVCEFPVVNLDVVLKNVEKSSNREFRANIARYNAYQCTEEFLHDHTDNALFHAKLAFRFSADLEGKAMTNVGYVLMAGGSLDAAEAAFKVAATVTSPPLYPALPLYDLGVLSIKRGDLSTALAYVENAMGVLEGVGVEIAVCQSLLVPRIEFGRVALYEFREAPNLVLICRDAVSTLNVAQQRS